jgi:hypothetical protein
MVSLLGLSNEIGSREVLGWVWVLL